MLFLFCPSGHRVGRLRPNGPQIIYGRRSDTFRRAGLVQHGDWLVQALSPVLIGGPDACSSDSKSIADISGQQLCAIQPLVAQR